MSATKAASIGLVDRLAGEDSLTDDAIAYARELIAIGPRPTRDRPLGGDIGIIEQEKNDYWNLQKLTRNKKWINRFIGREGDDLAELEKKKKEAVTIDGLI